MGSVITVNIITDLPAAAKQLLEAFPEKRILAFYGQMGAGKTTFIKAICESLGVDANVSSPTFSIVNEYRSSKGEKVFHFDFYRIKDLSEAYDLGYEDYFYSDAYCFIEWPEKIEELLPEGVIKVIITTNEDKRVITW